MEPKFLISNFIMHQLNKNHLNKIIKILSWIFIAALFLAFVGAGISKILWNNSFEHALGLYKVPMTSLQKNFVLVFIPPTEILCGIFLLFRKTRNISLFAILGLLTAFTVLQARILANDLIIPCGCYGPYLDSPVGVLTISRNIIMAIMCIFLINKTELLNILKGNKMKNLLFIILCVSFFGCGQKDEELNKTKQKILVKKTVSVKQNKSHKLSVPSESTLTEKTDFALKKVRQGMDAFSQVLGLQAPKFSSNTNLFLQNYTNILLKISITEFQEFLRDFNIARKGKFSHKEAEILRNLIRERMNQVVTAKGGYTYSSLFKELMFSYVYESSEDQKTILKDTKVALELLEKHNFSPLRVAKFASMIYLYAQSQRYYKKLDVEDDMLLILDNVLSNPLLSEFEKADLQTGYLQTMVLTQPENAINGLRNLLDNLPKEHQKKPQFLHAKLLLEGLENNLRGFDATNFANEQLYKRYPHLTINHKEAP